MEQPDDIKKILSRVKKMMTLAQNDAASEGERDNAIRMAHATLAKYNLSMAEVDEATHEKADPRLKDALVMTDAPPWIRSMAAGVADLFFCAFFFTQRWDANIHSKTHLYFVGRQSNIITAKEMTTYLVNSIQREAVETEKRLGGGSKFKTSFCKGASTQVYWRCKEIRKQAEAAQAMPASSGTSLVLSSLYAQETAANERMLAVIAPDLKTKKSGSHGVNILGYAAGAAFGKGLSLNKQVEGGATKSPKLENK